MCLLKPTILTLIIILFAVTDDAFAQRPRKSTKNQYSKSLHNYRSTRVRGQKAKLICPVFEHSNYPYHGLGFKFGDPFALTYKFYPSRRFSFALDFGKASSGLYNRYFREQFISEAARADTLSDNAQISYSSHQVKTDLIAELKLLYHLDIGQVSPGLQVYLGIGWEWKSTKIDYGYFYNRTTASGSELFNEFRVFRMQRATMGPQAVLGIEYAYFQIPISAFMEVEYFADMQADPGWRRFEGGVGLRYIF